MLRPVLLPIRDGAGVHRFRSHGPTYVSRREWADWATLIANRVVVVARNASAFRTILRSVVCHEQASCTMSSASTALPSMRYAMPNRRGRTLTKTERLSSSAFVSIRRLYFSDFGLAFYGFNRPGDYLVFSFVVYKSYRLH